MITSLMCLKIFGVSLVAAVINYNLAMLNTKVIDILFNTWKVYFFAGIQIVAYLVMAVSAVGWLWMI